MNVVDVKTVVRTLASGVSAKVSGEEQRTTMVLRKRFKRRIASVLWCQEREVEA